MQSIDFFIENRVIFSLKNIYLFSFYYFGRWWDSFELSLIS